MGSGCSSVEMTENSNSLIQSLMPLFYVPNVNITEYDAKLVEDNWNTILNGKTSDKYLQTGLHLFHELFYDRIANCSTTLQDIVGNISFPRQIFLIQTIGMVLKCMNNFELYSGRLQGYIVLCWRHRIRCYEVGMLGDVILYSLQEALGEAYDVTTEHAWMYVYSKFLHHTTPALIKYNAQHMRRTSVLTAVSSYEVSYNSNNI